VQGGVEIAVSVYDALETLLSAAISWLRANSSYSACEPEKLLLWASRPSMTTTAKVRIVAVSKPASAHR
jgi:hypothetical protein